MSAGLRIDALKCVRRLTAAVRSDLRTELAGTRVELFRCMLLQAVGIMGLTVTLIKLPP